MMHVLLSVIAGPHVGQTFLFDRHDHFLVGRAKPAHFRLPEKDPYFSRLHFMLEVNPPACRLVDLGSTNGTQVNGVLVQTIDLRHGDLIQGGDTTIRVTLSGESLEQSPATLIRPPLPDQPSVSASNRSAATLPQQRPASEFPDFFEFGYQIQKLLGEGGMGRVYLAQRLSDNTPIAIKVIKPNKMGSQQERLRFLREINILKQLDHSNIVSLIDSRATDQMLYLAMEYVAGMNIEQWAKTKTTGVSVKNALQIMVPVLKALSFAHGKGFVHRDVKPNNILLSQQENRYQVKLADFGLARIYQDSKFSGLTLTGDICGTPKFMAPEQITDSRNVQPACDQYLAAATLYWLLTQRYPHDFGPSLQKSLQQILLEPAIPAIQRRNNLPPALNHLLQRALSKDPGARYPSIDVFASELKACLADL